MRLIITCGCGDTTQFAKDAFKILYPKEDMPDILELNDNNKLIVSLLFEVLAIVFQNEAGECPMLDVDSKFAYYIATTKCMRYDEEHEWYNDLDVLIYDLKKGHQL